jgi:lamin B
VELDQTRKLVKELQPENANLKKRLEDAKSNLEDEMLKRIDLQNQFETMRETSDFEKQILEQQLTETKIRKQVEISEIDHKKGAEYEQMLAKNLAEMRESYETQIGQNKEEMTRVYENKIHTLQNRLDQERINSSGNVQEIRELDTKVTALTSKNLELESSNSTINQRLNDLTRQMDDMGRNFRNEMARKVNYLELSELNHFSS